MAVYHWFELTHAALSPYRAAADATRLYFKNPLNPLAHTQFGKTVAASCEMFERVTRRYGKPEWGIDHTVVDGVKVPVHPQVVWQRPFCKLLHFERATVDHHRRHPKVLMVAPMSGHYATLLRGTVEGFLPNHDVYITDWEDARMVPLAEGRFDLDDYIDYLIEMMHALGGDVHLLAVCQPSVPVFAAVSRMEAEGDPYAPLSMTLMGGPIDTRSNPTAVNKMAHDKDLNWFRRNVISTVPFPHPGFMREVYPGFLQITGFMTMNLDRHVDAHRELFLHMVRGDGDNAAKHKDFYDEYLAVCDLTAEFYLQTVQTVFINHCLPKGNMKHRGKPVDPSAIRNVALMTVEGEKDDITGGGQTEAAQRLATNIPDHMRVHYVQPGVGHYGVFNGSRFRKEILPRVSDFMLTHNGSAGRNAPRKGVSQRVVALFGPDRGAEANGSHAAEANGSHGPETNGRGSGRAAEPAAGGGPIFFTAPQGAPDDLTLISGVGPKLAKMLNDAGVWHFWQIARLTQDDIEALDERVSAVKARILRDNWIAQASRLSSHAKEA